MPSFSFRFGLHFHDGLSDDPVGMLQLQQGLTSVYVPQEPLLRPEATIFDVVSEGVAEPLGS